MEKKKLIPIIFVTICILGISQSVWGQTPPPPTPDSRPIDAYFPDDLGCDESFKSNGPSIGLVTIGKTTLAELNNLYSKYLDVSLIYPDASGEVRVYLNYPGDGSVYRHVDICVIDNVIVAANGVFPSISQFQEEVNRQTDIPPSPEATFELLGIKHFIAKYGLPDVFAYSTIPTLRLAFWFEQGIAADFYIVNDPTQNPSSFGAVSRVIYFPFQGVEGYENRWPYNKTLLEEEFLTDIAPYLATDVPTELNPFDFEAIVATITSQPANTSTATFVPVISTPTITP